MIKQIEVTQRDRDIAAAFLEEWEPGPEMTVVKLAKAFARHRHAAMIEGARLMQEAAALEADREVCNQRTKRISSLDNDSLAAVGFVANAIRALDPAEVVKGHCN